MNSRQNADFAFNRPDIFESPAIEPLALEQQVADNPFLNLFQDVLDFAGRVFGFAFLGAYSATTFSISSAHGRDVRSCRRSACGRGTRCRYLFSIAVNNSDGPVSRAIVSALPGRGAELLDRIDDLDDLLLGELDRLEHVVFGHFAGEAFDHSDGLAGAGHDQVQIAFLQVLKGGHGDEFAVDPGDANGAGHLVNGICDRCNAALAPIMPGYPDRFRDRRTARSRGFGLR